MSRWNSWWAVPVALIALPILAAAGLAWRGAAAERAAGDARWTEAAELRLAVAAKRVEIAAETAAAAAVAKAAAALTTEALHGLTVGGDLLFAAVYRGEQRLFPPEDSGGATAAEARALAALGPALAATRRRLIVADSVAWRWAAAPGGPALLTCRRDAFGADYCAALEAAALRPALGAALLDLATAAPAWSYVAIDPDGAAFPDPASGFPPAAERPLGGALAGWRLEVRADPAAAGAAGGVGLLYAAAGLPSAALWAAGAWRFHQSRRAQLAEGRRRVELAARLSHDLRTPLANLRLYAELIRRRADHPAAVADYAAVLEAELARLDRIADAAVAAAAGAPGADDLRPRRLDPQAVVADLLGRSAPRLAAAGCALSLRRAGVGGGGFDGAALERIVGNLLDNACKFAAGTTIEVATALQDGVLTLTVRDHGPGLAAADPIRRGAGLGLSAAARLAAAHGGDLRLEDAAPGLRAAVRLHSMAVKEGG